MLSLFDNPPDPSQLEMDPLVVEIDEWGDENLESAESWIVSLAGNVMVGNKYPVLFVGTVCAIYEKNAYIKVLSSF